MRNRLRGFGSPEPGYQWRNRVNLKLVLIASAVAAVGMAMGQGAAGSAKGPQGGGKGMMRQGGPGGPGGMRRQMPSPSDRVKQMTKMLNLTPAQQKKLLPVYEASGKKFKALMEDKKMNEQQKREAFQKMRDENRKKVAAILTPAQLKKLDEMRKSMRGPGGPGGRGPGAPAGAPGSAVGKASGIPPGVNPNGSMKKGKNGGVGH